MDLQPNQIVIFLYFLMTYFLMVLAILFTISGFDDLFFDWTYWFRYFWRIWKTRNYEPLSYEKLIAKKEQAIAVLIPCWHEAQIIGAMLKHNCYSLDYQNYYFFVGVYPNDPETVAEIKTVTEINKNVICVMGDRPGPTNKAANLNQIYKFIKKFEKKLPQLFDIFVFHDAEDMIHPLSFRLYNYLIPRKDMIQIPIFPLKVSHWNFTHWLYADEFAENHTKNIIVREAIRAHVPSAGVGTAFRREALETLEDPKTAKPFAEESLTEDYRTSLALRVHQLKQIFVTQYVTRMQWRKSFFRGTYVLKPIKEIIAIRALFPLHYMKSIRQKARWIIGIVFQEWEHSKWPNDLKLCYTLAHDRKSSFTHFINGFGYFISLFWIIYSLAIINKPQYPSLQEQFYTYPWFWWLIIIATIIMLERLLQRMIATFRIYGFIAALLTIPRAIYGNFLNLHAVLRAYIIYLRAPAQPAKAKQVSWDKTENNFIGVHFLLPFRQRLGDLLVKNSIITEEQLLNAIFIHQRTGQRLGEVLTNLQYINEEQLTNILAKQYNLEVFPRELLKESSERCKQVLPARIVRKLTKYNVDAVSVSENIITVAIDDPSNEYLLKEIISFLKPFRVQFVLKSQK